MLQALRWATEHAQTERVEVRTDSALVANQVNGVWSCNADHLSPLRDEAARLAEQTGAVLRWIPRGQNQRADALSRLACSDVPSFSLHHSKT